MSIATCIGCGCTDQHACVGANGPCSWLVVDYAAGVGVCSCCESHMGRWAAGDRSVVMMVAKIMKAGEDEPYYLEANDMASLPYVFAPEAGDKFTIEWLEMSEATFQALPQFEHIRLAQRWAKLINQINDAQAKGDFNAADRISDEAEQLRTTIAGMGYNVLDLLDDELPESLFQPSANEAD